MFQLNTDEKIIAIVHRHWFVISWKLSVVAIFILPPIVAIPIASRFVPAEFLSLIFFLISIYVLIVLLAAFFIWVDFYLDMWIITDKRVLDIEQLGLFRRSISEFTLNNIQDVSVSINGISATIFKYGDLSVQTAGENSFSIRDIPYPETVKDIIMKCHEEACRK
jgi:hypothetical protein